MVEQDTSHQHSTVEPFFFTQRLPPFPKYENFKSRLWTVVSVCIATNDAVLIWPWSSRTYLNSVRSSFISALAKLLPVCCSVRCSVGTYRLLERFGLQYFSSVGSC